MDFKITLDLLIKEFQKHNIQYALIGGFAMGVLGVSRSTIDIDFLVSKEDLGKLKAVMKAHGYNCVFETENVSQYVSDLKIFGEVDFLHAFRDISMRMLKDAQEYKIFDGKLSVKVLKPEDIVGLKIQSIANNPSRQELDFKDIESILELHKQEVDWDVLREYFNLFDKNDLYLELKEKYSKDA